MNRLNRLVPGAVLLATVSFSQPQSQFVGKVVDEFEAPSAKISLRLSYIGSTVTDDNGEFVLPLPTGIEPGKQVEFVIAHDRLAIFSPARGIWNVPKEPLAQPFKIILLPKGDPRFLNANEMKALMNKLISEATKKETHRLLTEKTQLEQQLASAPQDPLAEDAKRLGFSKEQLLAAIEKVKAQLQESENPYDVGLAALYDKHYGKAAQLIEQAITAAEKKIREGKREEELLPEKYLNLGNARAGEYKLQEAVAAYEKAIALRPEDGEAYLQLGECAFY